MIHFGRCLVALLGIGYPPCMAEFAWGGAYRDGIA